MTPKEEFARWQRVGIEPSYIVMGPDVHEHGPHWEIMDAECEHIGIFQTKDMADVVAAAMEDYDRKMWRPEYVDPENAGDWGVLKLLRFMNGDDTCSPDAYDDLRRTREAACDLAKSPWCPESSRERLVKYIEKVDAVQRHSEDK